MARWATRLLAAFALIAAGMAAHAQTYPERTVRVVVPAAAGGGLDLLIRALTRELSQRWNQSIVVDNRGGGNGIVGTTEVITNGGRDGHVLLAVTDSLVTTNPLIYRNLPYDPDRDLMPITLIAQADQLVIAHPSLPAADLKELVALARRPDSRLAYGAWGDGSQPHLVFETLKANAGTDVTLVNYKGVAPVLAALAANEVQLSVVSGGTAGPLIRAGKVKVLAAASAERLAGFESVATIAEQGFGEIRSAIWFGLMAPRGTPPAIVRRIADDVAAVMAQPAFREQQVTSKGWRVLPTGPAEFDATVRAERPLIARMVAAAKVQPQ